MKKIVLFLLIVSFYPLFAQNPASVFEAEEIIFFGLDFTSAKMVGPDDFKSPDEIKEKFYDSWNSIVLKEKKKYNISKAFKINNVIYDFSVVQERNKKIDAGKIVAYNSNKLTDDDIKNLISEYDLKNYKEGIGLVVVIESFDKSKSLGTMQITFFEIATKKILFNVEATGVPGGFGLRNYWIRSFYNVLKDIEENYYAKWKLKYNTK